MLPKRLLKADTSIWLIVMIKYAIIIQARMGSTRRAGKISYEILGKPLLQHQINRLKSGSDLPIIIATTDQAADNWTVSFAHDIGVPVFSGSEDDVMQRYIMAAEKFGVENIIRIGGDDPLIDPQVVNNLVSTHQHCNTDFVYASHRNGWIYGTAAELITLEALKRAYPTVNNACDKEHVVSYIRKNHSFSKHKISPIHNSLIRYDIFLSVDYQEDLDLVEQILTHFSKQGKLYTFTQQELIELYDSGKLNITNKHLHEPFDEE